MAVRGYPEHINQVGKKEKKEKSKQDLMKIKKGKKVMQEGDLYENATTTEMKGIMAKQNKNDETIYENPEPSKPAEKKNVNKDGLIYADLTFNDQPKGQKKLVIHGLDSMTEYVKVDFTKKADPLPDSDDENNSPKN
ncbi:uncharacterized protein LOC128554157 [Mercenaria mercenaria]|uniref:uncharacterized protein LOC128554157 n=1 Tax=Mercenaria mercenaria TaxID=6596 RepID=UPI00234FA08C|nr:uncharacterized protein LOC128554157 [Mercenaria mercenaria]